MRAADLVGPNARNFSAANKSTIPAASGSSGPTTVRPTRFCFANRASPFKSVGGIATFSAISLVPAFPSAQKIRSACGDWRSFHARACSRPPLPMTRIFIAESSATSRLRWDFATQRLALLFCPRFSGQNRQLQLLCVPDNCERGANANLFSDEHFVQVVHTCDRLTVEHHNQIAFAQSSAFGRAVFLD